MDSSLVETFTKLECIDRRVYKFDGSDTINDVIGLV